MIHQQIIFRIFGLGDNLVVLRTNVYSLGTSTIVAKNSHIIAHGLRSIETRGKDFDSSREIHLNIFQSSG